MYPDGRTDQPKQAAFNLRSNSVVRPLHSPAVAVEEPLYANQMLAMRTARATIEHLIQQRSFDEQRRIYKSLLVPTKSPGHAMTTYSAEYVR
jgi:hypothetical protein